MDVGAAVAVGVLEVVQVGRREHEQAAAITANGRRPAQLVGEDHAAIGLAVAVGVFEQPDDSRVPLAAARRIELGRFPRKRVVAHFGDIHPAVFVEAGVDRTGNLRLRGEQLEAKSVLQLESSPGLVRGNRRNSGQFGGKVFWDA
jgi:hypothetical protein